MLPAADNCIGFPFQTYIKPRVMFQGLPDGSAGPTEGSIVPAEASSRTGFHLSKQCMGMCMCHSACKDMCLPQVTMQ